MSAKVTVVNLSGRVTLPNVAEFQKNLQESIDKKPLVYASLSQTEEIDLSGIQLLYAARRYASERGTDFHLIGSVPESIAERLYRTGFISQIVRDGKELESALHEFDRGREVAAGEDDDA